MIAALLCSIGFATATSAAAVARASDLRLVPFPRQVEVTARSCQLPKQMALYTSAAPWPQAWHSHVAEECARLGIEVELRVIPAVWTRRVLALWLTAADTAPRDLPLAPKPPLKPEGYALTVAPAGLAACGAGPAGLFWAAQTLRQLLRANVTDGAVPCLTIRDWPALRWRGFQDDLTRGPSTKLDVLKRQVDLGAFAKLNFFTYYLEHQYLHPKHPDIGPPEGSFSAEELQALVAHADRLGVDILGCQQSFGHFHHILKHERYKGLRETGGLLCPVKEETYQLLDDLYADQIPHTSSPFFNVCCDETYGLGQGPSKELAAKIGVGGVYARHMRRVHELVTGRGKRMMMWGDIILQHPEHLDQIPKDTIMLTWGYGPRASFEDQIVPFAKSGYEFFVCPGVNCWRRQLPDFTTAATNIRNFVRDGVKHGALGMLNTAWDDDGENFQAPNWHGTLWGAECAWTGSTTDLADFNRRLGAVLFGERGDHFGQALELLAQLHSLPGYDRLFDRRFWELDTGNVPTSLAAARRRARKLLGITRLALTHLRRAKADATVNADLLDYFLFGAERVQLMATRQLNFLRAAEAYNEALQAAGRQAERTKRRPPTGGRRAVSRSSARDALDLIQFTRQQHLDLRARYAELWLRENKPYALDRVLARFDKAAAAYAQIADRLQKALSAAEAGQPLPSAEAVGLLVLETGVRSTRPTYSARTTAKDSPWQQPRATHRCGIEVAAGSVDRANVPVELDLRLPAAPNGVPHLHHLTEGEQSPVPCQIDDVPDEKSEQSARLTFVMPGKLRASETARFLLYLGDPQPAHARPALRCDEADDGYWIENGRLRVFLGHEGAHLYHWIVKPTDTTAEVDLTHPGDTQYFGFADIGGAHRSSHNRIELVQAGPVMVRLQCRDDVGLMRTVSFYAGQPWTEVVLDSPTRLFWNFDDARLFGGEGKPPATYLFSDGATGKVGKIADAVKAQAKRSRTRWSAKLSPRHVMLAMLTPEVDALHCVGPGAGWGGVGIENSPAISHFILYGGPTPDDPATELNLLRRSLDLANQPRVTVFGWERRQN